MSPSPPSSFAGQFVFRTGNGTSAPNPGFLQRRLGKGLLIHHESLPVYDIYDASGKLVGLIAGHPIQISTGKLIEKKLYLNNTLCDEGCNDVESELYQLGGSFLFILDRPRFRRFYLDASGSLSAVYDKETGAVASTAGMLLDPSDYASRFDRELYETLGIRRDGWFPAGLTAHHGIERLLCNHYLDLDSGRQIRHWPKSQIPTTEDPDESCRRIMRSVQTSIAAMRLQAPISIALTAGRETRLLLAACRDIAGDVDWLTVDGPEASLDVYRATTLAREFGFPHRTLPLVGAGAEAAKDWHARTGHCMGGTNMWTHPSIEPLEGSRFFIGGLGGEVGRGFFWRPTDTADTVISASGLTSRFGMRPHPRVEKALEAWLPSVAPFDSFLKLDLAYLELRLACWAFSQAYASPTVRHMYPLVSRASYSEMLALPPEWRRSSRMITRSIELFWPELLRFPFNKFGDWRDGARMMKRAAFSPHLITKKIRKVFGR